MEEFRKKLIAKYSSSTGGMAIGKILFTGEKILYSSVPNPEKDVDDFFEFIKCKKGNRSCEKRTEEIWEDALLYTREYAELCGYTFVHHGKRVKDNLSFKQLLFDNRNKMYMNRTTATQVIDEFFKFIEMKKHLGDYNSQFLLPSKLVDRVWHVALLNTEYYAGLCGENFIHHTPDAFESSQVNRERYQRTLDTYLELFGQEPPADIWENIKDRFDYGAITYC